MADNESPPVDAISVQPEDLARFIDRDRSAINYYLGFGVLLLAAGVVLFVSSYLVSTQMANYMDGIHKLGGLLFSSLGLLPLKEYLARRDRIAGLRALKERLQTLLGEDPRPEVELQAVYRLVFEIFKKAVVG